MVVNVNDVPERYHDYVRFLKKYCLKHKISFEEANTHIICIAVAEEYGVSDTRDAELLEILQKLKCDDVCEIVENAYDKNFPRCYGAYIGFCQLSEDNPICIERMPKDKIIERRLHGVT